MIRFLRRYQKSLFIIAVAILLIGIFVGLGGYLLSNNDMSEAVASVGSAKIPYSLFVSRVNQYEDLLRSKGLNISDAEEKQIKQEMLRDMIVNELLQAQARKMGLVVTDRELAMDIENTPAFERNGVFDPDVYAQAVRGIFHQTEAQYESQRKRSIEATELKQLIYQSAKLSPEEVSAAYASARKAYAKAHHRSLKGFAKKDAFAAKLQERRALDLINFYLRQIASRVEIRTYLKQRESGA